jgi:uncharacterized membrane protein
MRDIDRQVVNNALPMGYSSQMQTDIPQPDMARNDSAHTDNERLIVLVSYGLFLIAPPMGGLSGLIAAIIAHVRLSHARGTWLESHYRNQIRVFWTMLVLALAIMALFSFGLGFSALTMLWPFAPGWPFWQGAMVGLSWAMFLPIAGFLSLLAVIWYYWRLLRGFARALDDKDYS